MKLSLDTKLKDLPVNVYNDLDPHILSCLDPILYPDITEPTIYDYYEAYSVETGEIEETSSLWVYLNPKIPLDSDSIEVLKNITSCDYFTVNPRSVWICLIKNNDILLDHEKKILTYHLAEYPEYRNKLDSWVMTQY